MKLLDYIGKILPYFKDKRIKKKLLILSEI
jgi:hypothetical protein